MARELSQSFQMLMALADPLNATNYLRMIVRQSGYLLLAGSVAILGLMMANAAGVCLLKPLLGSPGAFSIVALIDFFMAGLILLAAGRDAAQREFDSLEHRRRLALEALTADILELEATTDTLLAGIGAVKDVIVRLARDPLDAAGRKFVIFAFKTLARSFRARGT